MGSEIQNCINGIRGIIKKNNNNMLDKIEEKLVEIEDVDFLEIAEDDEKPNAVMNERDFLKNVLIDLEYETGIDLMENHSISFYVQLKDFMLSMRYG